MLFERDKIPEMELAF
jgi:hypothetical protein